MQDQDIRGPGMEYEAPVSDAATDGTTDRTDNPSAIDATSGGAGNSEDTGLVSALRKRLGERDGELKKLRGVHRKFEAEMAERERKKLEAEGNYKALLDKTETELQALKPRLERAEAYEQALRASNDVRIDRIPQSIRAVVPVDYPPDQLSQWLDTSLPLLLERPAPDFAAGAGSSNGQVSGTLTDAESGWATRFGVKADEIEKARSAATASQTAEDSQ